MTGRSITLIFMIIPFFVLGQSKLYRTTMVGSNTRPGINQSFVYPENAAIVFVITGQSNSVGTAKNAPVGLPSEETPTSYELSEQSDIYIHNSTSFELLNIGAGNNVSLSNEHHGPEIGVIKYKQTYFPNDTIWIIKKGQGATAINLHLPTGSVYNDLRDNYLITGINQLIAQGKRPYIFLMYLQGERNSNTLYSIPYAYRKQLDAWKLMWEKTTGNTIPIAACEILRYNTDDDIINDAFADLETNSSNFVVVPSKDFTPLSDQHFRSTGLKEIARMMMQYFASVQSPYEQIAAMPYTGGFLPSTPSNLTASAITSTTVQLSWSGNTGDDTVGYIIYDAVGSQYYNVGMTTYFTVVDQTPSSSMEFLIRAYDEKGNLSDYSTPVNVVFLD